MGKLKPLTHHSNKMNKDIIIIGEKCHRNEEKEMIKELIKQTQEYKEELEKVRAENTEKDVRNRYYKEKLEEARIENIEKHKINASLRSRNIGLKMYIRELETKNEKLEEAPKRLQEENTTLRLMLRLDVEQQED